MGIFSSIKDAIFGHKPKVAPEDRPQIPAGMAGGPPAQSPTAAPATGIAPPPPGGGQVDVVQSLDDMAAAKGGPDLNYKSSIVDLMKLLDLDSSLDNRKQLADELGYSGDKDGSAEMNIWLHREVMRELAKNGGKVPASMTD